MASPVPEPCPSMFFMAGLAFPGVGMLYKKRLKQAMQEKSVKRQRWMVAIPTLAICLAGIVMVGVAAKSGAADATDLVAIEQSGPVFDAGTGSFDTSVTLSNERSARLLEPFRLIVSIDTSQVSLMNATGITETGLPYIQIPLPGGSLDQGQIVRALLKFRNPKQVKFNVSFEVNAELAKDSDLLPYPGPGGEATSLGI